MFLIKLFSIFARGKNGAGRKVRASGTRVTTQPDGHKGGSVFVHNDNNPAAPPKVVNDAIWYQEEKN